MSTANFRNIKAEYIYVPKNYADLKGGEDEETMEMIEEDVEYELEQFENDLYKQLEKIKNKTYRVAMIGKKQWLNDKLELFEIEVCGYDKNDDFQSVVIEVVRLAGYYAGSNIDYDYDEHNPAFEDKTFSKVFERVITILEKTLTKHFDRYEVAWQASNGETGYHKVK